MTASYIEAIRATPDEHRSLNDQIILALVAEMDGLFEQKEATDAALGKIALMQSGALAIIRDNGFVFEDIGREPGNWQHLAFTLYNLICEIDVEARHALGIDIGEDVSNPASRPCPTCDGVGAQAGAHTERVEPCPSCDAALRYRFGLEPRPSA